MGYIWSGTFKIVSVKPSKFHIDFLTIGYYHNDLLNIKKQYVLKYII